MSMGRGSGFKGFRFGLYWPGFHVSKSTGVKSSDLGSALFLFRFSRLRRWHGKNWRLHPSRTDPKRGTNTIDHAHSPSLPHPYHLNVQSVSKTSSPNLPTQLLSIAELNFQVWPNILKIHGSSLTWLQAQSPKPFLFQAKQHWSWKH